MNYDIIIIGSGPAGLAASLKAQEQKINHLTLEQNLFGGTVANYPKQKLVLTSPVKLPLYGPFRKKVILKEELMAIWESIREKFRLQIRERERVLFVMRSGDGFTVTTSDNTYEGRFVILGLGRRGSPRKLVVTGEELPKVTYSLRDADFYRKRDILVVGGGDSAIEAALSLTQHNHVTISYRQDSFVRLKEKNQQKLEQAVQRDRIRILFKSSVKKIETNGVILSVDEKEIILPNDYVFIMIGGEMSLDLLISAGVIKKLN